MEFLREKSAEGLEQLSHDTVQDNNMHLGRLYQHALGALVPVLNLVSYCRMSASDKR